MATFSVQVENWKQVADRLKALGGKLERKVLRRATRAGAKPVLAAARQAFEADNNPDVPDTGRLKRAIKVRAMKRKKGRVGHFVAVGAAWFQGETFYGAFREFGHKIAKRASNADIGVRAGKKRTASERETIARKNSERKEVRPYPFIGVAYEKEKENAAKIMEREILAGIEREANQK